MSNPKCEFTILDYNMDVTKFLWATQLKILEGWTFIFPKNSNIILHIIFSLNVTDHHLLRLPGVGQGDRRHLMRLHAHPEGPGPGPGVQQLLATHGLIRAQLGLHLTTDGMNKMNKTSICRWMK